MEILTSIVLNVLLIHRQRDRRTYGNHTKTNVSGKDGKTNLEGYVGSVKNIQRDRRTNPKLETNLPGI